MSQCSYQYEVASTDDTCPRDAGSAHDHCVFHLEPAERREMGVARADLRSAFLEDVDATDPRRRTYVGVTLEALDLSALVVDGTDVGTITFRNTTIDGTLDLAGSVFKHPIKFEDCRIGQLDVTAAAFEMDVTVDGSTVGGPGGAPTALQARRGSFERSLQITETRFDGSIEFAACQVGEWLDCDAVTVVGDAHFPNTAFERVQFVATTFEGSAEFVGATGTYAIFDDIRVTDADGKLDLSEITVDRLRVFPQAALECRLANGTVRAGTLAQPADAVSTYDLTDATVGDVDLDCEPDTFDRYRFYRTRFEGFPFQSYRDVLRANRWYLHEYVGSPDPAETVEGLEHTYLEAKQGASHAGDNETASMFFVREMRFRRRRYASHARRGDYSLSHRVDATLRWLTNGFLDLVAGYGERPQRTAGLALAFIVLSALLYPATGGLTTGTEIVTYGTHGFGAALDGLYFSIVTFATLGLGDVHPVSDIARFVAASEGLAGAFLTAIFVFSLGRRVTR